MTTTTQRHNQTHNIEDCDTVVQLQQYTIRGRSLGGYQSGFHIPQLKLLLDGGVYTEAKISLILITHTHTDHIHSICNIIGNQDSVTILCPPNSSGYIRDYVNSAKRLNFFDPNATENNMTFTEGLNPYRYKIGGTTLEIRPFQTHHDIPSQGYALYLIRKRLKSEYVGQNIVSMVDKSGIMEEYLAPLFIYTGDTNVNWLNHFNKQDLYAFPLILSECTFITGQYDDHTSWENICHNVNKNWYLTHLSRAIDPSELTKVVENRCHIWGETSIL
jgi:ribonuclease Z